MFKRAIWMGAGFGAGLGSSFWVKRAVTRRVRRYVPDQMRVLVGDKAKAAGRTVRVAVREGRETMRAYQDDAHAAVRDDRPSLRVVAD